MRCGSNSWFRKPKTEKEVCNTCGLERPVKPKEFWAFKVNRLVRVDAAAQPKPKAKPKNQIFELLRADILGWVKVYSKEVILPYIEEIYQEAKSKDVKEYFK